MAHPRVLVVDDNAEMATMLADGLNETHYDAVAVGSGVEARSRLEREVFDALVTDLRMPGVDGLELLAHSRRLDHTRPVILMTAFSAIDSAVEAIRQGAHHYLAKPFKLDELVIFLDRALDERKVRREATALRHELRTGHAPPSVDSQTAGCVEDPMDSIPPVTDEDLGVLVARAQQGDRAALEGVLARVAPAVYRFGLRMCRNPHDAEDVLQDTLLNVTRHLGEFEGRSSLTSWVFALTRSACTRKRRGLKNQPTVGDIALAEQTDGASGPEARAADQEIATAVSSALDGLSDEYREVILLRDVEGLSAADAAGSLGLSVDALKSRLHRAREALRAALRPMLEPDPSTATSNCPDVVAMWSRNLEGDLDRRDCAVMEKHVASCAACSAACDALKRALLACRREGTDEVPPDVQARVKEAVRARVRELRG